MDKRSEARVPHNIRFFVHIHECDEDPSMVGVSVTCEAIDLSTHGLQFKTEKALPPMSLLNITIGIGEPFAMYLLRGQIRWVRGTEGNFFVGVLLQEEEGTDLLRWAEEFGELFGGAEAP